jgi:hypothetical protein
MNTWAYLLGAISLISGALVWFLLPKRWIAWSKRAGGLLPQETIPPWGSLNLLGKSLYAVFVVSIIAFFAVLAINEFA